MTKDDALQTIRYFRALDPGYAPIGARLRSGAYRVSVRDPDTGMRTALDTVGEAEEYARRVSRQT